VVLNGPSSLWHQLFLGKKQGCDNLVATNEADLTAFSTEALAASTVKVAGRDVLGTWKVLISLGVAPLLYAFYALVATVVVTKANAPLKWRVWTPFVVVIGLPFIGYAALNLEKPGWMF